MTERLTVIACSIADSSDYDYIVDNAVHNTLGPLWSWAEEQGIKISFEKSIDNDLATISLRLRVDALFEEPAHYALFKLSFGELPYRSLSMGGRTLQPVFY
jgi:hypothetical protein